MALRVAQSQTIIDELNPKVHQSKVKGLFEAPRRLLVELLEAFDAQLDLFAAALTVLESRHQVDPNQAQD